jgi:hypothetical protein
MKEGIAENWDTHFYRRAGDVLWKIRIVIKSGKILSPEDFQTLIHLEKEVTDQFRSSSKKRDTAEEGGIDTYRLSVIEGELEAILEKYNSK